MNRTGLFSQECSEQAQESLEPYSQIYTMLCPEYGLLSSFPLFGSLFAESQISSMESLNINREDRRFEGSRLPHQALPRVLRKDEINRLLAVCEPIEYVIVEFYLRTGLRLSEGLHVKVGDIDFEEQSIFVLRGKRNKDRVVPFDSRLKLMLQKYILDYGLRSDDYLFCVKKYRGSVIKHRRTYKRTSSHYSGTHLYNIIRALADKAGLQEVEPGSGSTKFKMKSYRVHPHLLRHTALTMIQESCGDPFITKEIAGHSSIAMTEIYVHLALGRKLAAVEEAFKVLDKPAS